MESLTECNLCGGTRFTLFTEKRGTSTGKTFGIVRCDGCSLLFVTPSLTAEENAALYDEDYFHGRGFDSSVDYVKLEEEQTQRRLESHGIIEKIRILRPEADLRILDVGCGTGALLQALGQAGYTKIQGLELSHYAASVARARCRATIHVGDILDVDLGGAQFDVINATEVIEHLRDPMRFFQRLRSLLAPNGVFIQSTGNADGLYARWLGPRWPYLVPEGHLVYYTPKTLRAYFERAGLEAIEPTCMDRKTRNALLRCEDEIAYGQLGYVGLSDRGIKGFLFRAVASGPRLALGRAVTILAGKYALPFAINRASGSE